MTNEVQMPSLHRQADSHATVGLIGERFTFKATQADTSGAYTVIELLAHPGGGPPIHTHPSSEAFLVLEGEFAITVLHDGEPKTVVARTGDSVFVPGGQPHRYGAVGTGPGRTLLIFSPGAEMESFFAEAGTPLVGGEIPVFDPATLPHLVGIAEKHGMLFQGM